MVNTREVFELNVYIIHEGQRSVNQSSAPSNEAIIHIGFENPGAHFCSPKLCKELLHLLREKSCIHLLGAKVKILFLEKNAQLNSIMTWTNLVN